MTALEVIRDVDGKMHNVYTQQQKLDWLSRAEGMVLELPAAAEGSRRRPSTGRFAMCLPGRKTWGFFRQDRRSKAVKGADAAVSALHLLTCFLLILTFLLCMLTFRLHLL